MKVARELLGVKGEALYTPEQLQAIEAKMDDIAARIESRNQEIDALEATEENITVEAEVEL
jgi:hypothetical protein